MVKPAMLLLNLFSLIQSLDASRVLFFLSGSSSSSVDGIDSTLAGLWGFDGGALALGVGGDFAAVILLIASFWSLLSLAKISARRIASDA